MEFGVSIIICCYNSASHLPETLKYLALQQVPSTISWEVILINNASRDNTVEVANEVWSRFNLPHVSFKILEELNPGKNYAFEKGIREAKFEYLLTCDDDNWLTENYVATAFEVMHSDAAIGALGGLGIVKAEQPTVLTPEELKQLTVNGRQTWAATDHWVYGAGSLYRKSIVLNLMNKGWKQITAGRTGSKLISGEDAEICFMIYLSGYKIIADDRLIFIHFLPLKRQTLSFISKMNFWLSYSYFLMFSYLVIIGKEKNSLGKICYYVLISNIKSLMKGVLKLIYQKLIMWKGISANQKKVLLGNLGMICSILKNRKRVIRHNKHILCIFENHGRDNLVL